MKGQETCQHTGRVQQSHGWSLVSKPRSALGQQGPGQMRQMPGQMQDQMTKPSQMVARDGSKYEDDEDEEDESHEESRRITPKRPHLK